MPNGSDTSKRHPHLGLREIVYENQYQQVYRRVADFGDFVKEYFVTHYGTRAALVVVRGNDILLARQYRLLIDGLSWEILGGKVEEGETPEAAAVRECVEETGVRCRDLNPVIHFHPDLDTVYNPTYVFYSNNLIEAADRKDGREAERPVWIPLSRCIEMVFEKEIVDSLSIISLLAYQALKASEALQRT